MERTFGLVHEVEDVCLVCGFEGADVVVLSTLEDLCEGREVDAERHGAVTAVAFERGR